MMNDELNLTEETTLQNPVTTDINDNVSEEIVEVIPSMDDF